MLTHSSHACCALESLPGSLTGHRADVRRALEQQCVLQVGAFPHYGGRWAEWNGKFRDTVRSFIKGSEGPWAQAFASAVCGSPTIYSASELDEGKHGPFLCS